MDIHRDSPMDIPTSNKWTGKVKLNVVKRKYSPKRIIQLPVSCQLQKGEYFITISASETMDIPKEDWKGDLKFLMDFFQANKSVLKVPEELKPRFREIAGRLK